MSLIQTTRTPPLPQKDQLRPPGGGAPHSLKTSELVSN
jgi:hypothetical protein